MSDEHETAAEFLTDRQDFLQFRVVPDHIGEGYDVVLRLDGTYSHRKDAVDSLGQLYDRFSTMARKEGIYA